MRKLFCGLILLTLTAGIALAGADQATILVENAVTNPAYARATAKTANSTTEIDGYVESVELQLEGSTTNVNCWLVTITNKSTDVEVTLLTNANLAASTVYYPRVLANTTAGAAFWDATTGTCERIMLPPSTRLQLRCYNCNTNAGGTVRARVNAWR